MTRQTTVLCCHLSLVAGLVPQCHAEDLMPVREGKAQAVLVMASDADSATRHLREMLLRHTGVSLPMFAPSDPVTSDQTEIVLCTAASRSEVRDRLPARLQEVKLKPEGFVLEADPKPNRRIYVVGADAAGLRYAVGELWHYHLALAGKTATITLPLSLVDSPAFSKRMFWNWTHCTNWDDDLSRVHQTKHVDTNGTLEPYLTQPNGFEDTFKKIIDFQADHKLNGLIIWGFINDAHGGLASAQTVSKYAKANGVRILPGIGTLGYGGFYFGGDHPYNIATFMVRHPKIRLLVQADGKNMPGTPCPSDPVFQQWLREGADWYFTTLKDIGGVNLEHGDFFECHCPHCKKQRALPENDRNYHWDMMITQVPVIQHGLKINPGLWYPYACYDSYDDVKMSSPPKFLSQYPKAAITQWTYTKMLADPILNPKGSWPLTLRAPVGTNQSIGLLHQGSHWDVKRQWWGASAKSNNAFGGTYSLVIDLIQQACQRAIKDKSEGIQIVGQIGAASPQNELNYLAFSEFTWHPEQTLEGWITKRLSRLYGGVNEARRFLALVSDTTTDPNIIAKARKEAETITAVLAEPRQARRWRNLELELSRRLALATAGKT